MLTQMGRHTLCVFHTLIGAPQNPFIYQFFGVGIATCKIYQVHNVFILDFLDDLHFMKFYNFANINKNAYQHCVAPLEFACTWYLSSGNE